MLPSVEKMEKLIPTAAMQVVRVFQISLRVNANNLGLPPGPGMMGRQMS